MEDSVEKMVDMGLPKQGRAWVRDFDAEIQVSFKQRFLLLR